MTEPDDAAILQQLHAGSREQGREALRELYRRHAQAVRAFVRSQCADPTRTDDVVQDVFLRAARHADTFVRGSARPWLLTIAVNRSRDLLRQQWRREQLERETSRPEVDPTPDVGDSAELADALGRLRPDWRAAVALRYFGQLRHAEVAQALGVSLRTAKEWHARGLAELRATWTLGDRP